jgi:hypothetical protein
MRTSLTVFLLLASASLIFGQTLSGTYMIAWQNNQNYSYCYPSSINVQLGNLSSVNVMYSLPNPTACTWNPTNTTIFNSTASYVVGTFGIGFWQDNTTGFNFTYEATSQLLLGSIPTNGPNATLLYTNQTGNNNASLYLAALSNNFAGSTMTAGCCMPVEVTFETNSSMPSMINATYFFGAIANSSAFCANTFQPNPTAFFTSNLTLLTYTATTTSWVDSNYSYSYTVNASNGYSINATYLDNGSSIGQCNFMLTNYTAPTPLPNTTYGNASVGYINDMCCQPTQVQFQAVSGNLNGMTAQAYYSFSANQLSYCNSVNPIYFTNIIANPVTTVVFTSGDLGESFWQDTTFPFRYYSPTAGSSVVEGQATNSSGYQCDFEISSWQFDYNFTGIWGNPTNIQNTFAWGAASSCCLPVSANISKSTIATNNYTIVYNFGAGYMNNSLCQTMNTTSGQSSVEPAFFDTTLSLVDSLYGYKFIVNETSNGTYTYTVDYTVHSLLGMCSYTFSSFSTPATVSTLNTTTNLTASDANGVCCFPSSVTYGTPTTYTIPVNYTFGSSCNGTYGSTNASNLTYSLYPNGTQYWQDLTFPFQFQVSANSTSGYNFQQQCSFGLPGSAKNAGKLVVGFVSFLFALLYLH